MKILIGKKVILFPLQPADLDDFIRVHRQDISGVAWKYSLAAMTEQEARTYVLALLANNRIVVWRAMTKEGKASRTAGYIYIGDLDKISASISGMMDKEFAQGLGKQIRKDKYTYAQDTFHTVLGFCFDNLKLERVEASVLEENRVSIALIKKEGFTKEGVLRNYLLVNDQIKNLVIFSMLKQEFASNVRIKETGTA